MSAATVLARADEATTTARIGGHPLPRRPPQGSDPVAAGAERLVVEPPPLPALIVGHVSHARRRPSRYAFRHDHYQWLVDVAALPRLRWPMRLLARFDPRDHLDCGRRGGGIRGDVARLLAARGKAVDAADRVLMLAHARVLGHGFDPLTVFWCLAPDGEVKAVVFEVHNTFGERHAYLLDIDASGHGVVDKAFYVSPFNDTSGSYEVGVALSPDRVSVRVALDRDGQRVMTATTSGTAVRATTLTLLRVAARHLLMTQRVSLLIRWHGVRLWLRRLPVQPRPPHSTEENVR